MADFLSSPVATVVMLLTVTAMLVAVGVYVIGKVRALMRAPDSNTSDWLSRFRDMHAEGDLEDEEFRTIKSVLAERLQDEINDTDKPR